MCALVVFVSAELLLLLLKLTTLALIANLSALCIKKGLSAFSGDLLYDLL